MFRFWMPLKSFDVFVQFFIHEIRGCFIFWSHVLNVNSAIISTWCKDLLVMLIPSDSLHFVCMQGFVSGFALDIVKVPHSHCCVCRPWKQVLLLKRIEWHAHNRISVRTLAEFGFLLVELFNLLFLIFSFIERPKHSNRFTILRV